MGESVTNPEDAPSFGDETPIPQPPRQRQPRQPKVETPGDPVIEGVERELAAQDEKWGEQDHPLHGGQRPDKGVAYFVEQADRWRGIADRRAELGTLGWDAILLEEVFEALAETDLDKQLTELEQVAAVAINAIRSLTRQAAA